MKFIVFGLEAYVALLVSVLLRYAIALWLLLLPFREVREAFPVSAFHAPPVADLSCTAFAAYASGKALPQSFGPLSWLEL